MFVYFLISRPQNFSHNCELLPTRRISMNSADPPTVSVHLANEDPSRNITRAEGENVTLKCRADARPPVTTFGWFKNVSSQLNLEIMMGTKENFL